ncbi:MAG: hypothetical protein LBM78_01610, partial [Clostridiales bacterium]|nr:hypothetical protein [Clostridiales bacterium]
MRRRSILSAALVLVMTLFLLAGCAPAGGFTFAPTRWNPHGQPAFSEHSVYTVTRRYFHPEGDRHTEPEGNYFVVGAGTLTVDIARAAGTSDITYTAALSVTYTHKADGINVPTPLDAAREDTVDAVHIFDGADAAYFTPKKTTKEFVTDKGGADEKI